MKRMACLIALAAGTGVALGASPRTAQAEPAPLFLARGLQINLNTPEATDGNGTLLLDVNFRGGNVRSVELYIDGSLIKKQSLRTQEGKGVISFALEGTVLSEGSHDVLVKAFDLNGNAATATSRIRIAPEETNAIVRFAYPKRNASLQGVAPLEVKLDASIKNPYVMFFVDEEFLSLTNYAPFNYNWDTSKIANGPHTLIVKVYDGDTATEVQTLKLPIKVNNVGGYTNIQKTTKDLSVKTRKPTHPLVDSITKLASPETATPDSSLSVKPLEGRIAYEKREMQLLSPRRAATPKSSFNASQVFGSIANNLPPFLAPAPLSPAMESRVAAPTNRVKEPTDRQIAPNSLRPITPVNGKGLFALLANPTEMTAFAAPKVGMLARQTVRARRTGNVAVLPGTHLDAVPVRPKSTWTAAKPTQTAFARKGLPDFRQASRRLGQTFEVAFDDTLIAFDVAPRVEKGLPLAPFRAIFEHTGGTVEWYNKSKTVRAYNSSREIEFRIGDKTALVNNQKVTMEATPFTEKGRSIVPISFIRDSLNVKVNYDPATGRLRIESRK